MKWRSWLPWLLLLVLGLVGLWHRGVVDKTPTGRSIREISLTEREFSSSESTNSTIPAMTEATAQGTKHPDPSSQDDRLAGMMRRDFDGLTVTTHPDGRRSIHLGGRFQHVSSVVTAADGKAHIKCFSSHEELLDTAPLIETEPSHVPETVDF